MIAWETARHQVAIAGRATNDLTGAGLAGALVTVQGTGISLEVRTGADGHFHFLDLPNGTYTLQATMPGAGSRYGTVQAQAIVSSAAGGRILLAAADLALPPTALRGEITKQGGGTVLLAEVRLAGSGERALSDGDGLYLLAGVETGSRTVRVMAQGFLPQERPVLLTTGIAAVLNVTLVPA